jgi:hypothetical protein
MNVRGTDVLMMLRPEGGWIISGNEYENIEFLECEPLTKQEFEHGFTICETWKTDQNAQNEAKRQAIFDRLGITADEAKLLLS